VAAAVVADVGMTGRSGPARLTWRTRVLRGRETWATVGPVWTALAAAAPVTRHTQHPEWARALVDQTHDDDARWFLAEGDDGPLAALPFRLTVRRRGPVRVRLLANDRMSDGMVAPSVRPAALRQALLAAFAEAGEPVDVLSLNGLRAGGGLLRLATASGSGIGSETRWGGHSVIATGVGGDAWFASASRNLRAGLRKARNRAEQAGGVTVTTASSAGDVAAAFDAFVAMESSGWKAGRGALAGEPRDRGQIRQYLVAVAPAGQAEVRTLLVGGRPAAMQLATVNAGTLELFKVAYDEALADLSPSNLLMADLVRACCDRPDVERIDLMSNQPWHDRWHADELPTYKARDVNLRRPGGIATWLATRAAARPPRASP
jgi:CelD/BcsL family acetyltransferase involved in cellulose biosynthesis